MKVFRNVFFAIAVLLCGSGCSMFGEVQKPYLVRGEMVMEDSAIYEIAGLEFSFLNKSNKAVKSFTLVFYFFDEDGNAPAVGSNNVVLEIVGNVGCGRLEEDCISLDKFLYEIPEEPYVLDYMYVSRIVYEDGSEWTDPFGVYAFS